ncbi:MAG: hypothetical protein ACR2FS_13475 [Phormidesmis sp.]
MLTEKQARGAYFLANGRTDAQSYRAAGVSEKTFYKWKKKPEFMALVGFYERQRTDDLKAKADEVVSLASARDDEEQALNYQRQMVAELGELSVDLIRQIRADGVEELGPRYLGPIVKSFADSVAMLQATNDRLIGLEALIQDVQIIEQTISLQTESEPEGGGDEGGGGGDAA